MRKPVRRTLEAEDFHVEEADNGESALALIQDREAETLARYRPSVAVLCMSADPDAVPRIDPTDTPVRVMLKPFSADDLYHAVRDAITRSTDLTAVAEDEIVRAHAGLSKFAQALEASRTMRVHTVDLVVAARELRRLRELR